VLLRLDFTASPNTTYKLHKIHMHFKQIIVEMKLGEIVDVERKIYEL
jgi:hypothetical protein